MTNQETRDEGRGSRAKVAAVDFDGTICEDSPNIFQDFEQEQYRPPQPGVVEGLAWLRKNGFEIVISTCRPYEHRRYLENFLRLNECAYDYLVFHGKPRADVYIDDKALRFTSWPETVRQLEQQFGDTGKAFAQEPNTLFEEWLKRERWRQLTPQFQATLLDVGCGHAPYWPEWIGKVMAIEPDQMARNQIAHLPRLWGMRPDLAELEEPLDNFDLVVALGVLEHVADLDAFLDGLRQARRLFVTVPNGASFHRWVGLDLGKIAALDELSAADRAIGHRRYFLPNEFQSLLEDYAEDAGFSGLRFGSCGFKPFHNEFMAGQIESASALAKFTENVGLIGDNKFYGAELYAELKR